ncbi:MAG: Nif3-like dinuclear metal center hexameric protein [Chitinophagaceae bacterium]
MKDQILIQDIIQIIEQVAPPYLQESYDNSGIIVGEKNRICTGIILALDCTLQVIQTAIEEKKNFILTHHPLIFKGLKRITQQTEIEQIVIFAIQHDITIYAAHTNLDNTLRYGVNKEIAQRIGLSEIKPLLPRVQIMNKIVVFVPQNYIDKVYQAMSEAGAGNIGNYNSCSFQSQGTGTFRALANANPLVGEKMQLHREPEIKIEMLCCQWQLQTVLQAMLSVHPYEEVAYDIIPLHNTCNDYGSGAIGMLEKEISEQDFLNHLKKVFHLSVIKHTAFCDKPIQRVALCGGAGVFLLSHAIQQKADILITGDVKHHDFLFSVTSLILADIGHWESEQFTIDIFYHLIINKFPKFASRITQKNTNPVYYFI